MGRADQGPFSLAAQLRGTDAFLIDIAMGEDYIDELLTFATEVYYNYARALLKTGSHATSMGESLAGPDVVSPEYYRNYGMKYEKEVINRLQKEGYIVSNHICGNVDTILDDMINTDARILEIDEKTDFKLASRKANGKTCLLGPVSPAILRTGIPNEIRKETIKAIEIIKNNPACILGPGCALGGDTPVENIKIFITTAREFGNVQDR